MQKYLKSCLIIHIVLSYIVIQSASACISAYPFLARVEYVSESFSGLVILICDWDFSRLEVKNIFFKHLYLHKHVDKICAIYKMFSICLQHCKWTVVKPKPLDLKMCPILPRQSKQTLTAKLQCSGST